MKLTFLFLVCGFILFGCKSASTDLPEIILSLNAPEIQVKASDLADHIRIIPLETTDSSLLPERFNVLISKDYILTLSEEEIQQFDKQGKYIRRLATKGRAPGEYETYHSASIDDQKGLLYLSEWSNTLSIYNLQNGEFVERKTTPFPLGKIMEIKDDTLLCQARAQPGDTTEYSLCLMTLGGKILNGLPHRHIGKDFDGVFCYLLPDGTLRLQSESQDSLFTVTQFQLQPYASIKCTDNDDPKFSLTIIPYYENSRWYMMNVSPMYMERDRQGYIQSITIKDIHRFLVDKQENTGKHLSELYVDTLGISFPIKEIVISEYLIFPIKASILKEITENQLKKGNSISPALQELYENTTEEDNPILLIGECKP